MSMVAQEQAAKNQENIVPGRAPNYNYSAATPMMQIMRNMIPRFLFDGAQFTDINAVIEKAVDHETWNKEWSGVAKRYADLAERAAGYRRWVTARDTTFLAALYYHFAQATVFAAVPEKQNAYRNCVDQYHAMTYFYEGRVEVVTVPFASVNFPGYLWKPVGVGKPPVVLVFHGADSSKEEYHNFCRFFVERGMATLVIDGPGQGESRLFNNLLMDEHFHRAGSAAFDYIQCRSDLDGARVAVAGQCLGGFQALQLVAHDERFKACFALSPFYRLSCWLQDWVPVPLKQQVMYIYGKRNIQEIREFMDKITLEEAAAGITCPVLIAHGTNDRFVPNEDVQELINRIPGDRQLKAYPGGLHALLNYWVEARSDAADWIADQLK